MQDFGLRLLIRQDNLAQRNQVETDLRLAMVAGGNHLISDLFPEYFPPEVLDVREDAPEDIFDRPDTDYDYSGVQWQVPSADEEAALLEQFMADSHVAVDGGDL